MILSSSCIRVLMSQPDLFQCKWVLHNIFSVQKYSRGHLVLNSVQCALQLMCIYGLFDNLPDIHSLIQWQIPLVSLGCNKGLRSNVWILKVQYREYGGEM